MATALPPRSQIRLKSVSGSIASVADAAASDYINPLASNNIEATTLQDILAAMAGSISRIHGVSDFTNSRAGVFSHVTSVFSGSVSLKDGSGNQQVSITSAGGVSGSAALQAGGALTVGLGSTLVGNVDALSGVDVTGADLTVGSDKFVVTVGSGNVVSKGTISGSGDFSVGGNLIMNNASSEATLASLKLNDLTATRIVFSDSSKNVTDSANLTFDAATLTIGGTADGSIIAKNSSGAIKFQADASTGDTTIGRDLTVTRDISAVSGSFSGKLTIDGDLVVNGTTTTVNSTIVTVDDINIELGATSSPSDTSANGGGIILKGDTDHTIIWRNSQDAWEFSENLVPAGTKDLGLTGDRWQNLWLAGNADVDGTLDVADAVSLAASGKTTSIRGPLTVAEAMTLDGLVDANAGMSASFIKIDGDVATRLYIVDTDGSIKDEANLSFHDATLFITGALNIGGSSVDATVNSFDVDASGSVSIAAGAASQVVVDGNSLELKTINTGDVTVQSANDMTLFADNGTLLVTASMHVSTSADYDVIVGAGRDVSINAGDDLFINVSNSYDVTVGGAHNLDADSIEMRAMDGLMFLSASADIKLSAGGEIKFVDSNKPISWTDLDGIKFSNTVEEWDKFKTIFGEVSLLSALLSAAALPFDSRFMLKLGSERTSPASITGAELQKKSGVHFSGSFISSPVEIRDENVRVYLNGQLLMSKSYDAINYDYDIANDGTSIEFNFGLQKDDIITAFVPNTLASLIG